MVRKTTLPTEREHLNGIAYQWMKTGEYPANISETDVQVLGQTLYNQLEDDINTLVAETTLTRPEAEVWILSTQPDENHQHLTEPAIALLHATPATGFGNTGDDPGSTQLIAQELEQYLAQADKKIEDGEQNIGTVPFPDRDDTLTNPTLVWLDRSTVHCLKDHRRPDEDTLDEVITRCLDEPETRRRYDV